MVVGKPIEVKKNPNPSSDEVGVLKAHFIPFAILNECLSIINIDNKRGSYMNQQPGILRSDNYKSFRIMSLRDDQVLCFIIDKSYMLLC